MAEKEEGRGEAGAKEQPHHHGQLMTIFRVEWEVLKKPQTEVMGQNEHSLLLGHRSMIHIAPRPCHSLFMLDYFRS